ncbi:MAG: serpin family protein [Bacillota bacterium]
MTASNKIKTPMMNTTKQFSYMESDKFESVLLPYKTNNYSMLILLPKD